MERLRPRIPSTGSQTIDKGLGIPPENLNAGKGGLRRVVEPRGIEPLTSAVRLRRSPI